MSIPTEQANNPTRSDHPPEVASVRQVLKNRNFLLLWMAQLISQTILNAANFGLVALVSARQDDGAFMASLAVIAFTLPAVPFSAIAGVIVDRLNKRQVLWVSNLLRLGMMLLMFCWLLYSSSNVWPLFGLMFLTSLIGQFFTPAEGSAIPLLVGERELMPALSLFAITTTLAQAVGFLVLGSVVVALFPVYHIELGSLHLTVLPTDMLFVVTAAFYGICTLLILLIPPTAFRETHLVRKVKPDTYNAVGNALRSLWHDMMEGWHIVRMDRLLFFSVVQLSIVGIIMQLIGALAGTFVQVILGLPAQAMAIVLAPAAIGLVGASIFMPRITGRVDKVRLTFIGLGSLGIGFALLPISHWIALLLDPKNGEHQPLLFLVVVLIVFLLGVAMASVNIPTQTMMQERAPEEGRARVLSLQFMLYSAGTIPILLFAGAVARFFGFSITVLIVSACILLFCLWGARYLRRGEYVEGHEKALEQIHEDA